jgi:hypothetical protein
MQRSLLATASIAALMAGIGAPAHAEVTGSLDINVDYGAETSGMHSTFFQANANGRLEFGLTDEWNGQLEVFGTHSTDGSNTWYGKYHDNMGLDTAGAAFHANTTMDDITFGPFVMLEDTTVGDRGFTSGCCSNTGYDAGQNLYAEVGGEARWHWTQDLDLNVELGGLFHLDAPGAYSSNCGSLCDAFFAGGGLTWFFDDNTSLSGHFDWIGGSGGSAFAQPGNVATGQTGWDYGATITHQFEDSPFAAYVAYDGNSFAWRDKCSGVNYIQHDNVVSVGIKWFFNGDTVRSQHESAGFSAPHFERMINQSNSLDDVGYPNF